MQTGIYDRRYTASYQTTDGKNFFRGPMAFNKRVPKTLAFWHDSTDLGSMALAGSTVLAIGDQSTNDVNMVTSGVSPTLGTAAMNGKPGVIFGSGQFLSFADAEVLDYAATGMGFVANFSVATLPTTFKNMVSKSSVANNVEFALQVFSTGAVKLVISPDGTAGSSVTLDPGFTLTLNQPFTVDVCYNTIGTKISINGSNNANSATVIFNGTSPLIYGDSAKDGVFVMGHCMMYTQTLTATERVGVRTWIAAHHNITVTDVIPYRAVACAGQSNCLGRNDKSSAPSNVQGSIANALVYNDGAAVSQTLQAGVNNEGFDASSIGPEMEFSRQNVSIYGKSYLIKSALSGAWLANDNLLGSPGSFYPVGGNRYTALIADIDAAFAYERSQGREIEIQTFYWIQGEADMIGVTGGGTPYLLSYQTNLELLIDTLRDYLHLKGYAKKKVRFIAVLSAVNVSPYTDPYLGIPAKTWVNGLTQLACAAKPNCLALDVSDLAAFEADNLHWTSTCATNVGARIFSNL